MFAETLAAEPRTAGVFINPEPGVANPFSLN